ncbi:VanZ family protein [Peptococcaceae bacterium 1198_IL3148]
MKLLQLLIRTLPFLYMSLIWYLSSKPSDAIVNTGLTFDATLKESLHLIEFAVLYGLWLLAFSTKGPITPKGSKTAALLAIAYGLIDEIHQSFVPYRSATLWDFTKDTIGVVVSMYIVSRILWPNAPPRHKHNTHK